jgi:hypothetical protein
VVFPSRSARFKLARGCRHATGSGDDRNDDRATSVAQSFVLPTKGLELLGGVAGWVGGHVWVERLRPHGGGDFPAARLEVTLSTGATGGGGGSAARTSTARFELPPLAASNAVSARATSFAQRLRYSFSIDNPLVVRTSPPVAFELHILCPLPSSAAPPQAAAAAGPSAPAPAIAAPRAPPPTARLLVGRVGRATIAARPQRTLAEHVASLSPPPFVASPSMEGHRQARALKSRGPVVLYNVCVCVCAHLCVCV